MEDLEVGFWRPPSWTDAGEEENDGRPTLSDEDQAAFEGTHVGDASEQLKQVNGWAWRVGYFGTLRKWEWERTNDVSDGNEDGGTSGTRQHNKGD